MDGAYYQEAGRRSPENPDRFKVFAPRVGFAWRPIGDKTVFRGGYGLFFDSAEGREIDGAADVYPYVSRGNYTQSVGQPTPLQTSDSLFPSFAAPGLATPAANTFLAVSQSPEPRNPYVQQWSLGVQHEIVPRTTFEVNYIGTHGSNLLMRRNIAQAFLFDPANPQSVDARKPFPNFVTYIDSDWSGRSNYNALNTKLEHRGVGAILTFAYTWAKSTDSKSAAAGIGASGFNGWQGFLDNHDPERDYGLSDFDVDHRLVGSFVYNLPFGSGEKFAGDATGVKNAVVGGWQVNGIYTWQRGFPITITAADLGGLNDTFGTNRANLVGDPNVGDRTVNRWFNTAAFAQPAPGALGDLGRNTERGPGVNNLDLALFKNFTFTQGVRLQFRLESFNALNHTQFANVSTNLSATNFGVVTSARAGPHQSVGPEGNILSLARRAVPPPSPDVVDPPPPQRSDIRQAVRLEAFQQFRLKRMTIARRMTPPPRCRCSDRGLPLGWSWTDRGVAAARPGRAAATRQRRGACACRGAVCRRAEGVRDAPPADPRHRRSPGTPRIDLLPAGQVRRGHRAAARGDPVEADPPEGGCAAGHVAVGAWPLRRSAAGRDEGLLTVRRSCPAANGWTPSAAHLHGTRTRSRCGRRRAAPVAALP